MNPVMRESTSYDWIIEQLYSMFGLDTKGENFLAGNDIKFEFSASFTYSQALMMMKDFYVNTLLPRGSTFKGKELNKDEELGPIAENFIIEKCLAKIDARLPEHIRNTRGHLFTKERPTLACNQKLLFSQIDTMIAEMDGKEAQDISVGQVRATGGGPLCPFRPMFRGRGAPLRYPQPVRPNFPNYQPRTPATYRPRRGGPGGCIRCLEARRYDAARFHGLRDCPYL